MSETYIVTAKTIDEAMAEANRKYSAPGKDVSFTILEMPKKGFFGFGAKEAKVQVTVSEEENLSLDSLVAEMKSYRNKTTGGKYGDNDMPARGQKNGERQQNPTVQNPNRNMNRQQNPAPQNAEKPQQPKQQKEQEHKQHAPQNAQKADKPQTEKKPALQQEAKPESPKPDAPKTEAPKKDAPKPDAPKTDAPKTEMKKEAKPESPKAAEKPEQKPVHPAAEPEDKPAEKTGAAPRSETKQEKKAAEKPVQKTVVREVNILSDVKYDIPADTTVTKKYTPKTVEARRDPNKKTVVREVNILSDIPASDPNASPFRSVPGWDKKAAPVMDDAEKEDKNNETVRAAEEIRDHAAAADAQPDTAAAGTEENGDTVFTRHTDDEAVSMDALLTALPENVREPDRKKVGVTEAEMDAAVSFVNTLLRDLQLDAVCAPVACPEGEEFEIEGEAKLYPAVEITGDGSGILIGHHGETLDAIQCLLNLASIRKGDHETGADYVKISLDIENYRAKREETLRSLARRMAARAIKYKRNIFLEPMNAYERRIIHSELQNVENVSTHSVGADKNRKIIVTYEGPDKKPAAPRDGAPKKRTPEEEGEQNRNRRNRKSGGAGEKKDRPRPQKPQKLPIESLPDFLANPADEPVEHLREN